MGILTTLFNLVSFAAGIVVLIRLFKKEGVLKGILGILCMLYTFTWGWMHYKEENIKNVMLIWSLVILITIVLNVISSAASGSSSLLPLFA